ncbi:MAG: undecaprenyl-diphosphatase UppP [Anaerolineae bacterium]|nr:MAG: undecaprenyl-diphosphatase UppP [Anaerolineae bacterium]
MNLFHALLLGFIQGLTEFIPVSSTAHLLIGQTLLGLPADNAMFSFLVIVQLGTLVSLFVFYGKDLLKIVQAVLAFLLFLVRPRVPSTSLRASLTADTLLGLYILLATIPALLAGYLLKDAVEALFRQPMLQAATRLFAAAILLTLAETLSRKNRKLEAMTWLDALIIGVFQVLAVFPGASRSGTTISGGMFRGFDRPSAARFAFLMSVPVMLAAGAFEMLDVLQMPNLTDFLLPLAVGFVSAAVVGWLAIRWLIGYLSQRSLYVFAVYCTVVGIISLLAHWLGRMG